MTYRVDVNYFLLVFDRSKGEILELVKFAGDERVVAANQRSLREAHFQSQPEVEVVVLGAETEQDLRRTHSRYFQTIAELAAS